MGCVEMPLRYLLNYNPDNAKGDLGADSYAYICVDGSYFRRDV